MLDWLWQMPAIFQDVSYERLSEIILSTSTLTSPVINGGGFGPTGARCYGIGYTTGAASYLHEMRDLLWQGCKRILMYWVCGDFCVLMRAQQRHGHVRMRADASRHVVLGFVPCKAL